MSSCEKIQIFLKSLDPAYQNSAESFLSKTIE